MSKERDIKVPMDGVALPNIEFARGELHKFANEAAKRINEIMDNAYLVSVEDARTLNVAIQLRNIRNTTQSLIMYYRIIDMLLQNMESDIRSIYIAQKLWRENELRRLAQLDERDEKMEKNERDKEQKKKKASEIADAQTE